MHILLVQHKSSTKGRVFMYLDRASREYFEHQKHISGSEQTVEDLVLYAVKPFSVGDFTNAWSDFKVESFITDENTTFVTKDFGLYSYTCISSTSNRVLMEAQLYLLNDILTIKYGPGVLPRSHKAESWNEVGLLLEKFTFLQLREPRYLVNSYGQFNPPLMRTKQLTDAIKRWLPEEEGFSDVIIFKGSETILIYPGRSLSQHSIRILTMLSEARSLRDEDFEAMLDDKEYLRRPADVTGIRDMEEDMYQDPTFDEDLIASMLRDETVDDGDAVHVSTMSSFIDPGQHGISATYHVDHNDGGGEDEDEDAVSSFHTASSTSIPQLLTPNSKRIGEDAANYSTVGARKGHSRSSTSSSNAYPLSEGSGGREHGITTTTSAKQAREGAKHASIKEGREVDDEGDAHDADADSDGVADGARRGLGTAMMTSLLKSKLSFGQRMLSKAEKGGTGISTGTGTGSHRSADSMMDGAEQATDANLLDEQEEESGEGAGRKRAGHAATTGLGNLGVGSSRAEGSSIAQERIYLETKTGTYLPHIACFVRLPSQYHMVALVRCPNVGIEVETLNMLDELSSLLAKSEHYDSLNVQCESFLEKSGIRFVLSGASDELSHIGINGEYTEEKSLTDENKEPIDTWCGKKIYRRVGGVALLFYDDVEMAWMVSATLGDTQNWIAKCYKNVTQPDEGSQRWLMRGYGPPRADANAPDQSAVPEDILVDDSPSRGEQQVEFPGMYLFKVSFLNVRNCEKRTVEIRTGRVVCGQRDCGFQQPCNACMEMNFAIGHNPLLLNAIQKEQCIVQHYVEELSTYYTHDITPAVYATAAHLDQFKRSLERKGVKLSPNLAKARISLLKEVSLKITENPDDPDLTTMAFANIGSVDQWRRNLRNISKEVERFRGKVSLEDAKLTEAQDKRLEKLPKRIWARIKPYDLAPPLLTNRQGVIHFMLVDRQADVLFSPSLDFNPTATSALSQEHSDSAAMEHRSVSISGASYKQRATSTSSASSVVWQQQPSEVGGEDGGDDFTGSSLPYQEAKPPQNTLAHCIPNFRQLLWSFYMEAREHLAHGFTLFMKKSGGLRFLYSVWFESAKGQRLELPAKERMDEAFQHFRKTKAFGSAAFQELAGRLYPDQQAVRTYELCHVSFSFLDMSYACKQVEDLVMTIKPNMRAPTALSST